MPCNCDHMEPHDDERELSKVYSLLDELEGKGPPDPSKYGNGFDTRVYNHVISKEEADKLVSELCKRIQRINPTNYSLELQLWWRDHQRADRQRLKKELADAEKKQAKQEAIAKLTPYERKLLGL